MSCKKQLGTWAWQMGLGYSEFGKLGGPWAGGLCWVPSGKAKQANQQQGVSPGEGCPEKETPPHTRRKPSEASTNQACPISLSWGLVLHKLLEWF